METVFHLIDIYTYLRSYRTYEEWKRAKHSIQMLASCVLTVPMRNGNLHKLWKS